MKIYHPESNMFTPSNRKEWRDWLSKNHNSCNEIWLVYFKKSTGIPTISYNDSVEEALCFGWIDGIKKRIDEERYCHRFTPRRKNSNWSETNMRRARDLIQKGLMKDPGTKIFNEYLNKAGNPDVTPERPRNEESPEDLALALKESGVLEIFDSLAKSYRTMCVLWIESARKDETRKRRIEEVVSKTKAGKKIGMK